MRPARVPSCCRAARRSRTDRRESEVQAKRQQALPRRIRLAADAAELSLARVRLPATEGFEATDPIRRKEHISGGRLPILAMTAHAMRGDRARCLTVGVDGYLDKPIQVDRRFHARRKSPA